MCPNPPVISVLLGVVRHFLATVSLTSFSVSLSTASLLETRGILPSQVAVVNLGVLSIPLTRAWRRRRLPLTGEYCPVTTAPKIDWFSAEVIHLGPASCFGGMSTAQLLCSRTSLLWRHDTTGRYRPASVLTKVLHSLSNLLEPNGLTPFSLLRISWLPFQLLSPRSASLQSPQLQFITDRFWGRSSLLTGSGF
jgi:hypothetical protein